MIDLGGAPSSSSDRTAAGALNLNKNCHLQAVIFDFHLLLTAQQQHSLEEKIDPSSFSSSNVRATIAPTVLHAQAIVPDVTRIRQVAELLKVDLTGRKDEPIDGGDKDDLSLLLGETNRETRTTKETPQAPPKARPAIYQDSANDIRSKYADKLNKAVGGGVSMVDLTKSENSDKKGDAAGHFAARARATAVESSGSSSNRAAGKWMAASGTGQLLGYLHSRSMKLGLAATPVEVSVVEVRTYSDPKNDEESQKMDDFANQVRDKVKFDAVIRQDGSYTATKLIESALAKLKVVVSSSSSGTTTTTPDRCLWVSDRDDCLRAAKEAGLLTARIRPPNGRRGNVSAHYTVESVPDVQSVINEINGISFNTLLRQR